MTNSSRRDQQHPQEREDRLVVNQLLSALTGPSDHNLTELGRLIIRYDSFPGAREIQRDLHLVLQNWGLTLDELFIKTRHIHTQGKGQLSHLGEEQQDWS